MLVNRISAFLKKNILFAPLLFYGIASLLLFNVYRFKLFPDTTSYVSIARHYLSGNLLDAVNGYFAPLYSWLIIPILALGLDALISIKLLSFLIGFGVFISTYWFASQFELYRNVFKLILYTLIPICIYFVFSFDTPDLLLVLVLLLYLNQVFRFNYTENKKQALIAGILGAFAYLTKHYALPFFLTHYAMINIFHYFRVKDQHRKKLVLGNFAVGIMAFFIISGSWIGVMSYKYKEFTFSNAAKYNYAVMRPNSGGHAVGHVGFLKPPNREAISAWEDPSGQQKISWNPLGSLENLKHQLKVSRYFILQIIHHLGTFTPLYFAIMVGAILFLLPLNNSIWENKLLLLLSTLLLYTSGYTLILVVQRYLWLDCILILIMGGIIVNELFKSDFFTMQRRIFMYVFFIISFSFHPFLSLIEERYEGKELFSISQKLRNKYHLKGNIASQAKYKKPLYISFLLNNRFFGASRDGINCLELYDDLKTNNIDYYFVWEDNLGEFQSLVQNCDSLLKFDEITNGEIPELRIYDVRSKP